VHVWPNVHALLADRRSALRERRPDNPVLQLDAANAATLAAQVQTDAATRDGLVQAALGGAVVRVPRQAVAIGGQSSLAAMLDDGQGAGAYLMLDGSRSHLATQAGAGGIGWLALAAPAQRPVAVHWLALTVPALHDAAIDVLTPGSEGNRWSALPMRAEVANGALLSALAAAVSAQPCEAVVPLLAAGTDSANQTVVEEIEQERRRSSHGHHTIPVHLCGGVNQPQYADISPAQHGAIHAEIAAIALTIRAAEEYAYRRLGRIRMWEVLKLAQTDPGRAAIAQALEAVYRSGWWTTGQAPNTIGNAFTTSKPGYVDGSNTSLPWCTRRRRP
jgi:hypothetical protein